MHAKTLNLYYNRTAVLELDYPSSLVKVLELVYCFDQQSVLVEISNLVDVLH